MKALGLLSGGLDSTLAVKLILDQDIDVFAINFTSPFCLCGRGGCGAVEVAKKFNIPIRIVKKGEDYLKIIRNPKHGYGRNMNPCIDCRIYTLKKSKKYAKEIGASFIFTGEVLDERPMSQHTKALRIIEKETGLEGKILRPLSAKLLPETEAEKKEWVDREKLLDIRGRCRKPQIELAKNLKINDYPCPSGGCLLTYKEFADKVRDLFEHKKKVSMKHIELLKIGRHFRFGNNKIIVGRNENENEKLLKMKEKDDYYFEVLDFMGPITLLQGPKTKEVIKKAAGLTSRYSDVKEKKVLVNYGKEKLNKKIIITPISEEEIKKLRIS
jgi:tRNA U34 2-thiouridine synthase MnmA/TrmU